MRWEVRGRGGGGEGCASFVFHLLWRRKLINESVGSIMSEEPVGLPETP